MEYIYPSKNQIMEFFRNRAGYISVIDIATALVVPHVQRSNPMDEEWLHISGFLHELKANDHLLVQGEGQDIYHEKFSATPDRVKRYFFKDEIQDNNDLTKKTDEELQDILRKNVNPHLPESLHNRVLIEVDLRHKRKVEELLQAVKKGEPKRGKTLKKEYKTKDVFVQSRIQDDDEHILIGKRDGTSDKAHVIVDADNGSIRLEEGRQEPTDIVRSVETVITFNDGNKIKSTRERLEEIGTDGSVVTEVEPIKFSLSARTKEGLAETFSIQVPILIKNFSKAKVTLRNIQTSLSVPEGYDCYQSYTDIKANETIDSEDLISRSSLFSVSLGGRADGAVSTNPIWEENKNKVINGVSDVHFIFHFRAEVVSLLKNTLIEKSFDLTSEMLPDLIVK